MPIDLVIDERETDSKVKPLGAGSTGSSGGSTGEGTGMLGEHGVTSGQEQVRAEC